MKVAERIKKPVKHFPQRTCVGCRSVLAKRALIRIVRTGQDVQVDPTGKLPGRGAYLHNHRECWEKALKGSLAQALKTTLRSEDELALRQFLQTLPDEDGKNNQA